MSTPNSSLLAPLFRTLCPLESTFSSIPGAEVRNPFFFFLTCLLTIVTHESRKHNYIIVEDLVYMEDEEWKKEYVMADSGLIWRGSHNRMRPCAWNFAQFEKDILECCVYLLSNVGKLTIAGRAGISISTYVYDAPKSIYIGFTKISHFFFTKYLTPFYFLFVFSCLLSQIRFVSFVLFPPR